MMWCLVIVGYERQSNRVYNVQVINDQIAI